MKAVAKLLVANPDGKFLLMYRSDHPTFGKDPDLPGGMTESNELALQTALRETEEEIGLHIDAASLEQLYSGTDYSAHGTHYTLFIIRLSHRVDVRMSWEHAGYEWLNRNEFIVRSRAAKDTYMHMVADVMELKNIG